MKKILFIFLVVILFLANIGNASEKKLPVIDGEEVMAMVNNDPITTGEFNRALSSIHSDSSEKEREASKVDYNGILKRLITLRLIRQEAINIGLNELPEVKEMVEQYSRQTLSGLLRGLYVKNLNADETEIEKLYKEAVMEVRLKSVLINKKDEAGKIEEEIKTGGNFDSIVKRIISGKTAQGKDEGVYFKGQELLPQVIEAVSGMEIGDVSPIIEVADGFIIFRLEDRRFPENIAAKESSVKQALEHKRKKALEEYKDSLIKKYVKIDEKVLEGLNYESSEEEFEKLLKDSRVVAEIEGEQPVTVAELTAALKDKYFHGVETAAKKKKLNENKRLFFYDTLLQKRVSLKEALKQGIDKSPVFKSMVKEYENSVLFDSFLRKVIIPDIKLTDEEVNKHYEENIAKYSSPEMMRFDSIVFGKKSDAEAAVDRLKKGTDFKWLSSNTEGQVDKNAGGLIMLKGTLVTAGLSADVQKAISGAGSGDVRLYTSPEKYYYVLYIQDVFPSKPSPFEEVKNGISEEIFKDRLTKSIDDWAKKLREVYDVKVYATEF